MISEKDIKNIIEQVLNEMASKDSIETNNFSVSQDKEVECISEDIPDITDIDIKKQLLVPNSENKERYLALKETTPARVGIWRAGPRYKTETLLRFRADHAVAQDAVFTYVSEEFLKEMNLFSVSTMCKDKDEYLTRPDLGRKFDEETKKLIQEKCQKKPKVQIYISDGLSSTAIEANAKDTYSSIIQGLKGYGIDVGTPFFVKHGRVPAMDAISEMLESEVTVVLIGERPGLATGESMSCYMAYNAKVGMPESNRTVVSNIHQGGTPAVEAGAHIADVIKKILEQKASGLDLKL
ncbi:ethanolamine ammonia-lyase subunit EutC [Paramaledivibacter caminithermalis]|jgi:ethanolamine ammonia-lyase small subunit|uniref:Ethanolamine ammonia-lyase small subunit n=1 Tax=Paramaledivibacter caminithermalis (strain DSM 15212 / CIP 107654 / DViRD3) TaxID=1121301 RepID=A0A1M6PNU6_PARC5|nr:ethanolamine ammonia-lyase subunit EutC [Paramaledivibacter caminithermalis]SHK09626.1 Ethanolamine ammonia-lyase light chain [Paramaledivibacter caminithermalis DSM 15212]